MSFDLIISPCTAITMDQDRRVLESAAIGIAGSEITFVGRASELETAEAKQRIDGQHYVALPGLIDAHAHAGHGLTKTLHEDLPDADWINFVEEIYYRSSTPDFWLAEARLTALERLKFGVTTGVSMLGSTPRYDDLRYAAAHVDGMRSLGVRDVLGIGTPTPPYPKRFRHWDQEQPTAIYELSHEDSFGPTRKAVATWQDTAAGLTFCYPSPSRIGHHPALTLEQLQAQANAMRAIAEEYGTQIHAHSYAGDIKFAHEQLNILGPRVFTAHVTGISSEEIAILAATGTHVCSGPLTNAYIFNRCPVVELLQAGASVVFCTDASAPDRSYDLLEKTRYGLHQHRSFFHDNKVLTAGKALEMVTIDAAKAVGLDHLIGSLEPGKKADIILVNMLQAHLYPRWQEPLRLVYEANGHDVDTVIVNGRILMRQRQVLGQNETAILLQAQQEAEKALVRANEQHAKRLPEKFFGQTHY